MSKFLSEYKRVKDVVFVNCGQLEEAQNACMALKAVILQVDGYRVAPTAQTRFYLLQSCLHICLVVDPGKWCKLNRLDLLAEAFSELKAGGACQVRCY